MPGVKKEVSKSESRKKAGPKKRYTTEFLKGVVDRFIEESYIHGQAKPSDIAKFAREILNYSKIIYQHFTRDENVMTYFNVINNAISTGDAHGNISFIEFNPDKLLDVHGNNKVTLLTILRRFADDHRRLKAEVQRSKRIGREKNC